MIRIYVQAAPGCHTKTGRWNKQDTQYMLHRETKHSVGWPRSLNVGFTEKQTIQCDDQDQANYIH